MKLFALWGLLVIGNLIYESMFANTANYATAFEHSYWQGTALLAVWIFD
jgi:hypothetical protein